MSEPLLQKTSLFSVWLSESRSQGLFTPLDNHLAHFLSARAKLVDRQAHERFTFLVVWLSAATRQGDVCLDIRHLQARYFSERLEPGLFNSLWSALGHPTLTDWQQLLAQLAPDIVSTGEVATPLIYEHDKLYFQRLWRDEQIVADYFNQLVAEDTLDLSRLALRLTELFPAAIDSEDIDWQKVAVAVALLNNVAIISGGPGTGKTTTVAKLLAALYSLAPASSPRIMVAAPTGKAAARLTQSLAQALEALPFLTGLPVSLPTEAVTLHRLLGAGLNQNTFTYNADNPLHADIVIVDEASMIDLFMMARLIEALPAHTRLILLGDRDQLSSVEAGAILADLCAFAGQGYSPAQCARLARLTGYHLPEQRDHSAAADRLCLLKKSYRFSAYSGIGLLSTAINQGQSQQVQTLLDDPNWPDIVWFDLDSICDESILTTALMGYEDYFSLLTQPEIEPLSALSCFSRYRLLCALHEGPFGVKTFNQLIEQAWQQKRRQLTPDAGMWYAGRPVMILKNSINLGLFNGDIGITLTDSQGKLRVYFQLADGSIRSFSPYRLPEHETAFAMTVHKSQGSEFDQISIVLPTEYTPLLSRSLLYTAVTRAKKSLQLYVTRSILTKTVMTQLARVSGLADRLR